MPMTRSISADHVAITEAVSDPVFLKSPVVGDPALDKALGAKLLLKDETQNPIRSFKGRGTEYFAGTRDLDGRELVCASAGNFGQGLARAVSRRGAKVTVFVSRHASPIKIERMRALGATIEVAGVDLDEANAAAKIYARERRIDYVEDAAFPEVAEGAGTIAKELIDSGHRPDVFYVPVGGGALINGIGSWLKRVTPECEVVGVVAEGAPAYKLSFEAGRVIETPTADTIADGVAVRPPVESAVATMIRVVDRFLSVSDREIIAEMQRLHRATGMAIEPAGVVGIAAAFLERERIAGRTVATLLCGANLTDQQKRDWLGI